MSNIKWGIFLIGSIVMASVLMAGGCQAPSTNTNVATNRPVNTNTNVNSNTNMTSSTTTITTSEPNEYQANVKLTLESMGEQKASTPPIGAMVARSGADRVMEFALPTGEKVIYLDKGGMNYLILPNRKQFAELT